MLSLLKAKWIIIGLEAPVISWLVSFLLIAVTLGLILRLWLVARREARSYRELVKKLPKPGGRLGLPQEDFGKLGPIFEKTELKPCWKDFEASLVCRRGNDDRDSFLATVSAKESFSEEATIGHRLNLEGYHSLPGIITGIGLLFTFIAILIALLDVRLVNNRVQGIELLIQGLSGKFVSSIAALLMATLYIWLQKVFFHRLAKVRGSLVLAIDGLFPRLTTAHLLEESRQQIAEQTNAIRLFNSNLAPTLKSSITENLGPTMIRMVDSIEGLNTYLRQAEANKQDSITGSIEKLLSDLGESLNQSINRMGQSLSGGARDEMVKALSDAAKVVEGVNQQFTQTQQTLSQLIEVAHLSTAEQFREGRAQTENLTARLDDLMTQMSQHMMTNANATSGAARHVIAQAEQWSQQNATRFEQMLAAHTQQTANVEALRVAFETALGSFAQAIGQHSSVISNLKQVTSQVASTVTTIESAAQEMQETQTALQQVAGQSRDQVKNLAEANARQKEVWQTIQVSLDNYGDTFEQVKGAADTLLTQISDHVKNYTEVTNNGFKQMIALADNHFSNATSRLGASVGELDDVLSDLADTLGRAHPTRGQNGN